MLRRSDRTLKQYLSCIRLVGDPTSGQAKEMKTGSTGHWLHSVSRSRADLKLFSVSLSIMGGPRHITVPPAHLSPHPPCPHRHVAVIPPTSRCALATQPLHHRHALLHATCSVPSVHAARARAALCHCVRAARSTPAPSPAPSLQQQRCHALALAHASTAIALPCIFPATDPRRIATLTLGVFLVVPS